MKRTLFIVLLFAGFSNSYGAISWMGSHSTGSQPANSQTIHFYVEMYDSYAGCHAQVRINEGGSWVSYAMTQGANNGNNSTWSVDVNVKSNSTLYYFEGWDDYGASHVYDSGGGSNYSISINPTTKSGGNGNWNDTGNWCDGTVPSSTTANFVIAHNLTLNQAATVGSLTINSYATFTASDATARTLTISKSASGSSTTLSNIGTWANGTGGSTVVFTGAPGSGNAIHTISGTIAFQNITVNKTSGTSDVGVSFGSSSSVSGTMEIGSGGFVSTAPPTSFYGANAILKFNQGASDIYNVNSTDNSWSTSVIPNYITISSGTVNLNANRTATGDLLIDGGTLVLNSNTPNLTIQGNWTRTSGTFTANSGTVTMSGSADGTINATGGAAMNNLVINKTSAAVNLGSDIAVGGTLNVMAGSFNVPAGFQVSVTGTTTTNGGLILKSPSNTGAAASFIPTGTVTGSVTVERYIPAWSVVGGWHFLSSPVASQAISPNFIVGTQADYDFYRWNETVTDYPWINFKGSSFPNFTTGEGYLVSYAAASTKSFSGSVNQSNVTFTNMSYTGASSWAGWHLMGNPFTSAILWNKNDGSTYPWGLSNIEVIAQIMNEGGSYTALSANDPIPAMNGFMVHATSGTNSITIPLAARAHNSASWFKGVNDAGEKLKLTAASVDNTTYVETQVNFNPDATPAFDMAFDGHFLRGIEAAPQLFSVVGDEQLSVNTLPKSADTRTVSLGFTKGSSNNYTMNVTGLESFNPAVTIRLEDTKTSQTQDLRQSPSYSFTAAAGDNTNRFLLHFGGPFSINDLGKDNTFSIYTAGNSIFVNNNTGASIKGRVFVYNLMGQQLMQQELGSGALTKVNLNCSTGYYLVKVVTSDNAYSGKVFLQ